MRITRRLRGSPFGPASPFASASCLRGPSAAGARDSERSSLFRGSFTCAHTAPPLHCAPPQVPVRRNRTGETGSRCVVHDRSIATHKAGAAPATVSESASIFSSHCTRCVREGDRRRIQNPDATRKPGDRPARGCKSYQQPRAQGVAAGNGRVPFVCTPPAPSSTPNALSFIRG